MAPHKWPGDHETLREKMREDAWTFGRQDGGAGPGPSFVPALPGPGAPVGSRVWGPSLRLT